MSNSKSIGIGLLGCGRIGVMHAELIAQRIEGAHLAGVYDVVTDSAKKIATKFNEDLNNKTIILTAVTTIDDSNYICNKCSPRPGAT